MAVRGERGRHDSRESEVADWSRRGYVEGTEDGRLPRPWFRRWGWWMLPLAALGLIGGTIWGVRHIEGDITEAAPEILREAGIDPTGLEFEATYRNLEVTGQLPEGVSASQIERVLEDQTGPGEGEDIRNVSVAATAGEPAQLGAINVSTISDGETITLAGTVPTQDHADALVAAAEASGATVINNLTISGLEPSAADANGQIDRLTAILPSLGAGVVAADLALTDTDLTGSIDAADGPSAAALAELVGDGIAVNSPAPLEPVEVNAAYDGATIVLTGQVLSVEQAAELEAAAAESVGAENVVNNLTVLDQGGDIEGADAQVSALAGVIGNFGGLETAEATLIDNDLVVNGVGADAEAVDALNQAMASAGDAGLTVSGTVTLSETETTVDEEIVLLQAELDQLQDEIRENVVFASDSAELTDVAKGTLDKVVAAMNTYERPVVETGGHTDSQGPEAYNLELSQRRADSVVAYLVEQGIDAQRLQPTGFGESQPVATNDTDEGRLENRRVAFVAKEQF